VLCTIVADLKIGHVATSANGTGHFAQYSGIYLCTGPSFHHHCLKLHPKTDCALSLSRIQRQPTLREETIGESPRSQLLVTRRGTAPRSRISSHLCSHESPLLTHLDDLYLPWRTSTRVRTAASHCASRHEVRRRPCLRHHHRPAPQLYETYHPKHHQERGLDQLLVKSSHHQD
jgi:hypothetical protein